MLRNPKTALATGAVVAVSLMAWPNPPAPAAESREDGRKVVYRSMTELPRLPRDLPLPERHNPLS